MSKISTPVLNLLIVNARGKMTDKKIVLITGASSGIGAAIAIHFAKLGFSLAITGRNDSALTEVAKRCLESNSTLSSEEVFAVTGDLALEEDCKRIVDLTIHRFKKLDVLIPNAGVLIGGSLEHIRLDEYDRQMNINVRSIVHLMKLCTPYLVETKGNVVNISSVAGLRAAPGAIAYCVSKAALDQLTRCSALELASKGVRVNSVNPGVIITELHKRAGMTEEGYADYLEHCKTSHPLGRAGTPEEVAKAVAFLASDDASFITGVTLSVDGGRAILCPR